ncbi:hypothetical protein [Microbacterium sp. 4-7]|uniref:hypothetical protein n=1 Tax=Microbacterium sp. 4-7 TaxID=1885327 RepID=UPI0016507C80|nr:hypothetical protein [Microbacterium sp. 4-7]MBC6495125.1 hypothetical protein [Microbacterium sp. 4-7]
MEESDFYGISGMKETVCLSHITDGVLRDALGEVADQFECSFCQRTSGRSEEPFAVAMDELGSRVWDVVTWLY